MNVRASLRRLRRSAGQLRGQSLVEFAITLPVLLLIVLGTVDLGRAYFSTITIENAVKEGAFFGARNPECDSSAGPDCADPNNVEARVEIEADGVALSALDVKCFAAGTTVFTGPGKALADCEDGDLYYVGTQAPFSLITPLIANLVGNTVTLSSSATAVVITSLQPLGATPVPIPTTLPTPSSAPGMCTVPDFANTTLSDATEVWSEIAGFDAANITVTGPNGQKGTWQSVPPGTQGSCVTQTITVSNSPQATPTPVPTPVPTASPTPTPTLAPSATPNPTPSSTATNPGTPTPTPVAQCTVPVLTGRAITVAQGVWNAAGFTAANFSAIRPPNNDYTVRTQSIAAGQSRPCLTTTITVDN